jgi:diacylglycerol kinase family enzyme
VILVRDASISSLIAVGEEIFHRDFDPEAVKHWQGREIEIECDPPQTIQGDGEIWDPTPVLAKVLPVLTLPDKSKI